MRSKARLAVFTAQAPWGRGESFVLTEILEVQKRVNGLVIVPVRSTKKLFHGPAAERTAHAALRMALISPAVIAGAVATFVRRPHRVVKAIVKVVSESRSLVVLLKNLAILPKALAVARVLQRLQVTHIHAHWASVPATMAFVVGEVNGVGWSFTAHNWDIRENNLLGAKIQAARFARVISAGGRDEILSVVGKWESRRVVTLHLGTEVPIDLGAHVRAEAQCVTVGCIANLEEFKGHQYLIEACRLLRDRNRQFVCRIIGAGPRRNELATLVAKAGLASHVRFEGALPHDEVLKVLQRREIDVLVLPSIETHAGYREGIPVVLMEALAHRVPAISTTSGRIPELLGDGAGILVPPRDPVALADAVERIIDDEILREKIIERGFVRVSSEFNIQVIAERLVWLIDSVESRRVGHGKNQLTDTS